MVRTRNHVILLLSIVFAPLVVLGQVSSQSAANPLLQESTLPYHYPHFDRLRDEHYRPAIRQGMREQIQEVEAIANDAAAPTFENTIVALERSGRLLDRSLRTFFNLNSAHTNDAMQATQREIAPELAAHGDAINLNPKLFARIEALYDKRKKLSLDPESAYLLERTYKQFVRNGAKLSAEEKQRFTKINAELAELQTKFAQNVLKERNASGVLVNTREELEGLPESQIEAAALAAKGKGQDGKYLIALQNTSGQPPLALLKNRGLRQRIMVASLARNSNGGEFDNRQIVATIAQLRAERARLLAYQSHADYQIEDRTARQVSAVNKLLSDLAPKAVANARKELADLQAEMKKEGGLVLEPWDWQFYAEKVRKARYDFDAAQLRPYFEMNRVLQDGVFYAATQLYGLTFKERRDLPVYHPDVRVFEVFDNGRTSLGLFLADFYARPSKQGGAWAAGYVTQSKLWGTQAVVGNHLNIPKPSEGEPTLLTNDEVETMFHEFGHALHQLFSAVNYPMFSGTSVPRDFVEFPSQVNEMWAEWPSVLKNYALHHQTGAPLPAELLEKVRAAEKFNQGHSTTEYLSAALLDQAWHQLKAGEAVKDPLAFEAEALRKAGLDVAAVPPRYRTTYFSHVFSGGYSAGYYSYIWSEVLDADTVAWFKEKGGLKRENGDRFRQYVLSRGGSADNLDMYRKFRGRDPKLEPLLERRGLTGSAPTSGPSRQ
jgi:peptidyl-dipeptidase Dcp